MDREKAADLLDNLIGMVEDNHGADYDTALKMGIEALSTSGDGLEPVDDTIFRQAAIDAAIEAINEWGGGWDAEREARDAINALPSAQPEPQWIPCSETEDLPEHEVLCCDRYGEELIGWLSYSDDQWLCESDGEMMYDPIAWREKPEPWKGEQK